MLTISTENGVAEAIVATPPSGSGRGVLFFMDAFGLRPRIQDMVDEIASWGHVVLAPNVFYRDGSVAEVAPRGDLTTPEGRETFFQVAGPRIGHLTSDLAMSDNAAYLSALQSLPQVEDGPVGVVGFCMGTRLAMRAAGRHPDAVAACAGFHGGGLVTDAPDSPHLELATARAEFLFGNADKDGSMTPQNVADLSAALDRAGLIGVNEIYEGAPAATRCPTPRPGTKLRSYGRSRTSRSCTGGCWAETRGCAVSTTTWLIDKSALVRLGSSPDAAEWASRITRGLVSISTVTRLEVGYSVRSAADLARAIDGPPLAAMPVDCLTPTIEERAVGVQRLLAERGQHRAPSIPDLLVAATAELTGRTVLHVDKDFELIAEVTGQPLKRLAFEV